MSSFNSSDQTASDRSLALIARPTTRIVDEFEPEAQPSVSYPPEPSGPYIGSHVTRKQLQEIRETYGIPETLE